MGQFKPMVKMETTEPSVELKLKKGGHVDMKKDRKGSFGHAFMKHEEAEERNEEHSMEGKAPKKPSMAERRKAMSGALLNSKKGGKVAKKADGGMMGVPVPTAAPVTNPLQRAALMRRAAQMAARTRPGAVNPGVASVPTNTVPAMKKGGKLTAAEVEKELKQHESEKASKAHKGLKMGGSTTKMDTAHKDRAHGTGEVKEGKPAGFKRGGHTTKVVDGDKVDRAHGTGGIKVTNAGGFKKGGEVWENRPANSAKPGVQNTSTGEVKEANAGGFKKGGAAKKAYATGGSVNDAGRAVAMPKKPVSQPVANSLQSGTFKKGGKVLRKADGGQDGLEDLSKGAYDRTLEDVPGMGIANAIRNAPGNAVDAVMRLLGKKPSAGAGRGFVNPPVARKSGGRAK